MGKHANDQQSKGDVNYQGKHQHDGTGKSDKNSRGQVIGFKPVQDKPGHPDGWHEGGR